MFPVTGHREWLVLPANPNGRTNADVLKPWVNGMDLVRRPTGKWIVDFGWTMSVSDAALYEEPFRWVRENVYPMRSASRRKAHRERWWRHADPRPGMWGALDGLSSYIATPTVAKHRLFVWCDVRICSDHRDCRGRPAARRAAGPVAQPAGMESSGWTSRYPDIHGVRFPAARTPRRRSGSAR